MKARVFVRILALAGLVMGLVFAPVSQASADSAPVSDSGVVPVFVPGNPTCVSLGYDFGFKVDPPNSGTYAIDGYNDVTVSTDGVYFDWTSTLGMDAVLAKGGPNANSYIYDPPAESFGDGGLASPINPNTGTPYGLSHIEFCYDYELTVSKTANTSFTRTFLWDIEKSVTPATWNLFSGDSGTSAYTVDVTKTGYTDSGWAVSGMIDIYNYTPIAATVTGVSDMISGFGAVVVSCPVTFPYALPAGGHLACSYSTALPDGSNRTNTASVTTTGMVGGGSASAAITFGAPTTIVNGSVDVSDSMAGDLGSFSDSGSVSYEWTFTCDGDEGTHNNIATIEQTGQSDSASVTVNCYDLNVTKDASTSFTRTWNWTIDKSADQSDLLLSDGQLFLVNYEVTVDAAYTDSAWAATGNIHVANPAPMAAELTGVIDLVSGVGAAVIDCGVTFPYSLPAGETLHCTYSIDLPDAAARTNTATATLQNYSYDPEGVGTPSGTTDFSGSASVDFSNAAMTEIDECIDVNDTNMGVLGTVCAGDAPKTFTYSLWFGKHVDADVQLECGENTHTNIADFVTNDTWATGSDSWTVNAEVSCLYGCTLTQGYWKTHSSYGPAPYDDAWMNIGGADAIFFSSGKTYYQVLWTAPAGNAYYNLAHQYIAAKLNILNGASSTDQVNAAIAFAETFFSTYTPDAKLSKENRNAVLMYAAILDSYNNGLIGPGHCSE